MSGARPEPPRDEQRPARPRRPTSEVPADRPAHLEHVARLDDLDEVRRHLPVGHELDGDVDRVGLGRRGDRVRALRLVAVLGGQPHVDVLAGAVARPPGHVEPQRARLRASRRRRSRDRRDAPRDAGRARSVAPVPLLPPRVAVVVVAVALPEAGLVLQRQRQAADPLRALPEVQVRDEQPRRAAVLGRRAARRRRCARPTRGRR